MPFFFYSTFLTFQALRSTTMGKQIRKTLKPRVNPLGDRVAAGAQQAVTEQQMTLEPDQVLPVVEKV